jgi:hypothetical protein
MSRAYWVSTPRYTVLVVVNAEGRIVDTAQDLKNTWLRRRWASCHLEHIRRWGPQYRVVRLA